MLLQNELEKDLEVRQKEQRSRGKRFGIFILRLIVAILIIALIAAAGLFLYLVVTKLVPEVNFDRKSSCSINVFARL